MRWRWGRNAALTGLVAGALLALPSVASAKTLCVGTSGGACTTTESSLTAALTAAASGDTIQLGPGTYTTAATAVGTPVTLKGVGIGGTAGTTVTTTSASGAVLWLNGAHSAVSDLEVLIPSNGASDTGLDVNGAASNVSVVAASGANEVYGVDMEDSGSSFSGTVDMRAAAAQDADLVAQASASVTNSLIEGGKYGIFASGTVTVTATRVLGMSGGDIQASTGSDVTVKDSLLTLGSPCNAGCSALYVVDNDSDPGEQNTLVATQDTLVAGSTAGGQPAGTVAAQNTQSAETTQLTLDSTVAVGFPANGSAEGYGLDCYGSGTSGLSVIYSNVNFDGTSGSGTGCTSHYFSDNENQGGASPVLPLFVNAAAGDYHIPYNSPLVDAGDPTLSAGTDLDGNPRIVNGKGSGGAAISDIGAYEYQRAAPTARISAPSTGTTGTPITFVGTGSSDPNDGEGLTYSWKFDTGYTSGSPTVGYAFTTPGTHTVTLTVTAPTGLSSTATATVVVALPAPTIVGLRVSPSSFRRGGKPAAIVLSTKPPHSKRGTTIYFTLSEAATATLTFAKVETGREQGGSCLAPTHARRHLQRCTRYVPVNGSLSFSLTGQANRISFDGVLSNGTKLGPGKYQLTLNAQASSGPPATPSQTTFTIRR
jgi:hypothetical protein